MVIARVLFLYSIHTILISICAGFDPPDKYFINCGSPSNISIGTRVFIPDSDYISPISTVTASASPRNVNSPSYYLPLLQTARIFTKSSKYTFKMRKQGRHWIRLYFHPFLYKNYNMNSSRFSIFTQDYLLHNLPDTSFFTKEYSVNVTDDSLVLTFLPSVDSFAYINAIEVVSVPDDLIEDTATTAPKVGMYTGLKNQGMETVARINMGGSTVTFENDTLGRTWIPDRSYITQPNSAVSVSNIDAVKYINGGASMEIAPATVYGTAAVLNTENDPRSRFNMTWSFAIDRGFRYFVRLHFCDVVSSALNQLYFDVFLGSWIVASDMDLSVLAGNILASPYYLDIVTPVMEDGRISVSIAPSDLGTLYPRGILNGVEIMRFCSLRGSYEGSRGKMWLLVVVFGCILVVVGMAVGLFLVIMLRKRRRRRMRRGKRGGGTVTSSKNWVSLLSSRSRCSNRTISSASTNYAYCFPFSAVLEATNNFDEMRVIGHGGFGKVYKGELKDGTKVAVKRGNKESQQGADEFRTEIETLSQFRHRHLVSLIGYCDESEEMILLYEYMDQGTLKNRLYGSSLPPLTWLQRLNICIGAARGLHYLHTAHSKALIHRDVKSANILLDHLLLPKVSDFGLSKPGPDLDQTHVSTAVKGSFGYLDPDYFRRQHLSEKSDVYSFGVVLLEVLSARPVIDPSLPRDMVSLPEFALRCYNKGVFSHIVDPLIAQGIRPDSLRKYGETAAKCLAEDGGDRPSMGDVLWNLEYALQLQEMAGAGEGEEENSVGVIAHLSPFVHNLRLGGGGDEQSGGGTTILSSASDISSASMSKVFSQLIGAEGR